MNIVTIYEKFPTESDCIRHLEDVRWRGTPVCPYCKSTRSTPMPKEHRHHCNGCNTTFSVTVDTIFHHTHLDLQKWFLAISLVLNAKKGMAARQLARDLKVNKSTAWYMGMRIRNAMFEQPELMRGIVEMDECYIGGKPRKGSQGPHKRGRGTSKAPVVGMIERGGKIVAQACDKVKLNPRASPSWCARTLRSMMRPSLRTSTVAISTSRTFMPHRVINHQVCYADGEIHTNSIEGFWGF